MVVFGGTRTRTASRAESSSVVDITTQMALTKSANLKIPFFDDQHFAMPFSLTGLRK
jgi:hypothetical protein